MIDIQEQGFGCADCETVCGRLTVDGSESRSGQNENEFVTVRKSVAGGAIAVEGIRFSSIATGIGGVTVRLFFTVGGNGILRVPVSFLFCSGGTCMSVSSAARVVFRGFSVGLPLLLEARALWLCVLFLRWSGRFHLCVVRLVLRCCSGRGRRPGRGKSTGKIIWNVSYVSCEGLESVWND